MKSSSLVCFVLDIGLSNHGVRIIIELLLYLLVILAPFSLVELYGVDGFLIVLGKKLYCTVSVFGLVVLYCSMSQAAELGFDHSLEGSLI